MLYDMLEVTLSNIDDRMQNCKNVESAFQFGITVGRIHRMELDRWYREGCKGPEPEPLQIHTTEHYILRHLRKQWNKLVKELK
jgi:hypothetical protein